MTIAGSDSSGGAGIQADLKTFSALGVYGASVITAVTAQNTLAVDRAETMPQGMVHDQIRTVLDDLDVDAVKIGMLSSSEVIREVFEALDEYRGHIVLDPVMVAKSGDSLLADDAVDTLRALLLPRADLITPNLPEAAVLTDAAEAKSSEEALAQGQTLLSLGARAVLVKGGHGSESVCTDWLIAARQKPVRLTSPRIRTTNTHGTGCTYSAAIAACLAKSESIEDAVRHSHHYLAGAIRAADRLGIGAGHGPVHHFHGIWDE
ncbi:MAG: bifunctional hydroxymethylpyrimidine kinase/phosphomethylpyrimidine kinase [Gammaproteobacteria bacterium]|nr:bifunctional hydroxymethylpyrimidine kinase/phosphomethylpyrimidine kinase [Gammaproteobacteria bacterium]MYD75358.1 bifunctional hydroxymethylpyrimidine kinase/phosphomethylpyrimidine kinase [Gammaproteobacteria bacterium]MYJ52652.1 bifunctional hydroxymethylpyrimidine kinase/phosphomethylpyrimidine kinase [Gammaproteobacteria bacterium]